MRKKGLSIFLILVQTFLFAQTVKTDLVFLVNEPAAQSEKTPVLIMLHGYGSNENDLFDIAKTFDKRFITFSLRAPIVLDQDSYAWYILNRVPGQTFTYDYKQAEEAAKKIKSFISEACKVYHVDSTNVYVLGFSQGAILSYDLAFRYPNNIKGILALSGKLMEESKKVKTNWTNVAKTNFFVAHGTSDNVISSVESEKIVTFLKTKQCVNLNYKTYDMQHTISGAELNDIRTWLSKSLSPEKKSEASKK